MLELIEKINGERVQSVRREGAGAVIVFENGYRLNLEGCRYNDQRCESCRCDKNNFRVTITQ